MKKIVQPPKDENGLFIKEQKAIDPEVSIDSLLQRGLLTIDRIMKASLTEASTGTPSRESVMNLKDCMSMLKDLKAQEDALLDSMTDEQIDEFLKNKK